MLVCKHETLQNRSCEEVKAESTKRKGEDEVGGREEEIENEQRTKMSFYSSVAMQWQTHALHIRTRIVAN